MLGLGAYESSSEDEVETNSLEKQEIKEQPVEAIKRANEALPIPDNGPNVPNMTPNREPSGPILGPSHAEAQPESRSARGRYPLSNSRTLIHDLTLPPVPSLDIPPSPSGSPDAKGNAKFAHFLSLKKQDVHFNEKLAASTSLRNPSLLKKLMEHAGIDDQAQYSTSLPLEVWDLSSLPKWGFKEELLKAQNKVRQKAGEQQIAGQRDTIAFVAATSADSSV
ncbi:hypothetical protein BBP40_003659 [Aspergillus hancockii]|nr:hypothetical protein BBP40_003659 [Aspergillus hancockii]